MTQVFLIYLFFSMRNDYDRLHHPFKKTMEPTTVTTQGLRERKPLSDEALVKLARAREMAVQKRRELAAQRAQERESLVEQKVAARRARMEAQAEKIAAQRIAVDVASGNEVLAAAPPPRPPPPQAPPPATAPRARRAAAAVVLETSDSEEEEGVIENARVFVCRRARASAEQAAALPLAPPATPPPAAPKVDEKRERMYQSMFHERGW